MIRQKAYLDFICNFLDYLSPSIPNRFYLSYKRQEFQHVHLRIKRRIEIWLFNLHSFLTRMKIRGKK